MLIYRFDCSSNKIHTSLRLADFADNRGNSIVPLQSFLFYLEALTFGDKPGILRVPNIVVTDTIIQRVNQLCHINTELDDFKMATNKLLTQDSIESLCFYLEGKFKDLIKRGNFARHNELVTKMLFHSCLSRIPHFLSDTEVRVPQISVSGRRVPGKHGYINLLIAEAKPATNGMRKRFVIEIKNKGINYLDLRVPGARGLCMVDLLDYSNFTIYTPDGDATQVQVIEQS